MVFTSILLGSLLVAADSPEVLPEGVAFRIGSPCYRNGRNIDRVAVSADGKLAITSSEMASEVRVWNLQTGQRLYSHYLSGRTANNKAGEDLSPDGKTIARVLSGKVLFHPLENCKQVTTLPREHVDHQTVYVRYSRDGKLLHVATPKVLETWSLEKKKLLAKVDLFCDYEPAYSPDRKLFLDVDSIEKEHILCVREVLTGKVLAQFKVETKESSPFQGTGPEFRHFVRGAFSPDGKYLAAGPDDETVLVWDLQKKALLKSLTLSKEISNHWLLFAPDSKSLFASRHRIDLATWELRNFAPDDRFYLTPDALFLPDGRTLLTTTSNLDRWDITTEKQLPMPHGYNGITNACYSPDGRLIAVWDNTGVLDLCAGQTGKHLRRLLQPGGKAGHFGGFTFTPDSAQLLAESRGIAQLYAWDTKTYERKLMLDWQELGSKGNFLGLTPDGKSILVSKGRNLCCLELQSGKVHWTSQPTGGRDEWLDEFAFGPEGKTLAIAGCDETVDFLLRVDILDMQTGKVLHRLPITPVEEGWQNWFLGFTSSKDGKTLLFSERYSTMRNWNLAKGTERFRVRTSDWGNRRIAVSPNGRWVAVNPYGSVQLLEIETGAVLWERDHDTGQVDGDSLQFSPDGRRLLTTGEDSLVTVWDLKPIKLPKGDFAQLWELLTHKDGPTRYAAIWALAEQPGLAEKVLAKQPPSKPAAKAEQITRWIAELDDEAFRVREAASTELKKQGRPVTPHLQSALAGSKSLEQKRRLEDVLEIVDAETLNPVELRALRGRQAVELANSAKTSAGR